MRFVITFRMNGKTLFIKNNFRLSDALLNLIFKEKFGQQKFTRRSDPLLHKDVNNGWAEWAIVQPGF